MIGAIINAAIAFLGWLIGRGRGDQRRDEINLGAATQRDADRKADANIIRMAERAAKNVRPNDPDPNDLDSRRL